MNNRSFVSRVSVNVSILIISLSMIDCSLQQSEPKKQPHIVIIVGDDLGWNDVGFHGSVQIPTPNIDALAYNGVILNRHYVLPTCTPSRSALLTGKYPIRYGLQGTPIIAGQPSALPLTEMILPQYLKKLGYSTHLIGKWHLGSYKKDFLPTRRGFDTHFGYWNGFISYRNSTHHTAGKFPMTGKDARRGFKKAGDEMVDRYATDVFTEEAIKIIESSKEQKNPMFLMISHLAVHSGNKGPHFLEVSNKSYNNIRFDYIKNESRRLYAGMLTSLDNSIGSVIESLNTNEMLEDSIILFMSDNGAPCDDPIWGHENFGSNWPLRGEKGAILDGGVRGAAAIWSPWLEKKHSVSENLFHITDWLPTLYTAAGGKVEDLGSIDGVDQWTSLTKTSKQMRSKMLINIDEKIGEEALIFNQWKVVKSNRTSVFSYYLRYSGDPGDTGPDYNMSDVIGSLAGSRLSKINCLFSKGDCMDAQAAQNLFHDVRSKATIISKCSERIAHPDPNDELYECFDSYCLFDVYQDPCEYRNVGKQNEDILNTTINMLNGFKRELMKQNRPDIDSNSDPRNFDGYWDTWLEPKNDVTKQHTAPSIRIVIFISCFICNFFFFFN